jgi:small subunit ribosomal protein S18
MTEPENPTTQEEPIVEAASEDAVTPEVAAEPEQAPEPPKPAPQARSEARASSGASQRPRNDDYDDDDDDYDDDDDDDDEDEPRYIDGPADYVQRERRGRGRRIGSDVRVDEISYKNTVLLTRFLDRRGRVLSRRKTRVSAKVQRRVVRAIKRARHLALLPYTADQTRIVRKRR